MAPEYNFLLTFHLVKLRPDLYFYPLHRMLTKAEGLGYHVVL